MSESKVNVESIDNFMLAYRKYIKDVSLKTMIEKMKLQGDELEEDFLLESAICWMVVFNMEGILTERKDPGKEIEDGDYKTIEEELRKGKMLTFWEDIIDEKTGKGGGSDHWFAIVSIGDNAYIVEHGPIICNDYNTWKIDDLIKHLQDIKKGLKPDRFYGETGQHIYNIRSYKRKPVTALSVLEYI
jgi:hypothetical protein